jgi:hypothetical protein
MNTALRMAPAAACLKGAVTNATDLLRGLSLECCFTFSHVVAGIRPSLPAFFRIPLPTHSLRLLTDSTPAFTLERLSLTFHYRLDLSV